jgi:hypothetical protein
MSFQTNNPCLGYGGLLEGLGSADYHESERKTAREILFQKKKDSVIYDFLHYICLIECA